MSQRWPGLPCSGFIPAAVVVVVDPVFPEGVVRGAGLTIGSGLVACCVLGVCDWEAVFSPEDSQELTITPAQTKAIRDFFIVVILGTCKLQWNVEQANVNFDDADAGMLKKIPAQGPGFNDLGYWVFNFSVWDSQLI